MNTPTDNAELDRESPQALLLEEAYNLGYHKVKNGCLQKPLRELNAHIDTVCREAIKEAVDYYAWRFECNTAVSEMYGWKGTLETAKEQTLRHFVTAQLNPNKDTSDV